MMVMVKAFGYGSGAKEVAQLLEETRVDYLGVAYIDEGISLRKAGVSLPIMVMNPEKEGIHSLLHYHLEPEIYSLRSLQDWLFQKDRHASSSLLKVHLKIDTGMHRLGLVETEWEGMKELLLQRSDVEVVSIFSHFSSADMPEEDAFTLHQLQTFEKAKQYFNSFFPNAFYHIANTAAIGRIPQSQMDMVRLGIGIYGVASDTDDQMHLQAVHRWVSYISQVKYISKGDSIGYGRSFRAEDAMKIATIPVGYADGYKRMLSNGKGWVVVNGSRAPIVGRVCMDMLMIDISNLNVQEGDEVVLMGGEMTLVEMARLCETIPYEILTSISQRVKRIYIGS
jgi:alanine racemase